MKTSLKKGVSKRTYDRNVLKFAKRAAASFDGLSAFIEKHTEKMRPAERETFVDELTKLIDEYIMMNAEMHTWCNFNGVDVSGFFFDVINRDAAS